jgi:hypothetical protein
VVLSLVNVDSADHFLLRWFLHIGICRAVLVAYWQRPGNYACTTGDTGPVDDLNRQASRGQVMLYM